jgi:two-component system, LuxR family, response regulator FixJ
MIPDATVFLVDDDSESLRSLRWLLESEGLVVETYLSGKAFLEAYDPHRPGCLLLDLRMPEMDGLDLQKRIVSLGPHPPIIFVSGHGDVAKCAEAMKAGAVDFLEKPANDAKVLAIVQHALEKDRRRRSIEAPHPDIAARLARLTPRERETMHFMLEGDATKRIASRLGVGNQTAAKHRARVLGKMGVGNEAELVWLLKDYPLE